MKKIVAYISICLSCSQWICAQEYGTVNIPDSLIRGAEVVKREEEFVLTIQSAAKYTVTEKHVYTILQPAANGYATYRTYYDKFCKINSVSGKFYNSAGKEIGNSRGKDWKDYSAFDGISLLSDSRYLESSLPHTEYPYTVCFEEEDVHNGTLSFPQWMPQSDHNMSVQKSKFTIVAPANYLVRYRSFNFYGEPVIAIKGDQKYYSWEIKDLKAIPREPFAPPLQAISPMILFAPSSFEVQGYKGNMTTWKEYGNFIYELLKGRDILPAQIRQKVHELTDTIKSEREKVQVLYEFLQQNTRYISIQLGIGGWQPFEAAFVAQKKYGDCKALSNYMIALLKEAGINGRYVEIFGGKSPPDFIADFPFSQFNHVICCVPLKNDSIWLECTNQSVSAGYLGSFTGNRQGLLVDETGGYVVHTPVYTITDNQMVRKVQSVVDAEGNLLADIISRYSGLEQDLPHSLINDLSKEEREKYLNRQYPIPSYQVLKNHYSEYKGPVPSVEENLQMKVNNFAIITGKRLFINPYLFAGTTRPVFDTGRRYDYIVDKSFRHIDSVEIRIPAGYKIESLPKTMDIQNTFGKYVSKISVVDDKIVYSRLMEQYSGRYSSIGYAGIINFQKQIYSADHSGVVLIKSVL